MKAKLGVYVLNAFAVSLQLTVITQGEANAINYIWLTLNSLVAVFFGWLIISERRSHRRDTAREGR